MLSGALDAHLDHYDSITTGHISQALHYLNIGRLPALVVLACWLVFLVLLASCCSMPASWSGNHHCRTCSWFLSVYCLRLLRCIIPVNSWCPGFHATIVQLLTEEEYIGSMALITGHQATSGNPCEGKLTDQMAKYIIYYWSLKKEKFSLKETKC